MPFIKLTQVESDFCTENFKLVPKNITCYLRTDNIGGLCATEEGTRVDLLHHRLFFIIVKETPEEILRMIKEAENDK